MQDKSTSQPSYHHLFTNYKKDTGLTFFLLKHFKLTVLLGHFHCDHQSEDIELRSPLSYMRFPPFHEPLQYAEPAVQYASPRR